MAEGLFVFDNEIGRWKPTKRGRRAVNNRRIFRRSGLPRYEPGGRAFTNPDQVPNLDDWARNGGNLVDGGARGVNTQRLSPADQARLRFIGPRGGTTARSASTTRSRQDLGQNASSRTGQGRGGLLQRVGRGARRAAARAANAAADALEERAARRRRR